MSRDDERLQNAKALYGSFERLPGRLLRKGKRPEDAKDLIQEAITRIDSMIRAGVTVRNPEALLVATLRNLEIDEGRRNVPEKHVVCSSVQLTIPSELPTPDQVAEFEERLQRIADTIDAEEGMLIREVFFDHRMRGQQYTTIAKNRGLTVRTVENYIARATCALKKVEGYKQGVAEEDF